MDADEVVVESDEPRSKRQKLTDSSKGCRRVLNHRGFLRRFQPTDILRRTAHPKHPVGRPKKSPTTDSRCTDSHPPPDKNKITLASQTLSDPQHQSLSVSACGKGSGLRDYNEIENGATRGVYQSCILHKKAVGSWTTINVSPTRGSHSSLYIWYPLTTVLTSKVDSIVDWSRLIWGHEKPGATECERVSTWQTTRTRMTLPIIQHFGFPVAKFAI